MTWGGTVSGNGRNRQKSEDDEEFPGSRQTTRETKKRGKRMTSHKKICGFPMGKGWLIDLGQKTKKRAREREDIDNGNNERESETERMRREESAIYIYEKKNERQFLRPDEMTNKRM